MFPTYLQFHMKKKSTINSQHTLEIPNKQNPAKKKATKPVQAGPEDEVPVYRDHRGPLTQIET